MAAIYEYGVWVRSILSSGHLVFILVQLNKKSKPFVNLLKNTEGHKDYCASLLAGNISNPSSLKSSPLPEIPIEQLIKHDVDLNAFNNSSA